MPPWIAFSHSGLVLRNTSAGLIVPMLAVGWHDPEASHRQLRKPGQFWRRPPRGEEDGHRVSQQPTRHEGKGLRGGAIEPLRVVDHTEKRAFTRGIRKQAQGGETHQQLLGRSSAAHSECSSDRSALRLGEPVKPVKPVVPVGAGA